MDSNGTPCSWMILWCSKRWNGPDINQHYVIMLFRFTSCSMRITWRMTTICSDLTTGGPAYLLMSLFSYNHCCYIKCYQIAALSSLVGPCSPLAGSRNGIVGWDGSLTLFTLSLLLLQVRVAKSNKLVGFISAVPAHVRIYSKAKQMVSEDQRWKIQNKIKFNIVTH